MNTLSESDLDLLDRFIRDEVTPEERTDLLYRIEESSAWKEAYLFRRQVREAGRRAFHSEMRGVFRDLDQKDKGRRGIRPIWLAIAASLALLISALLWLFPTDQSKGLMAEYHTFPNIVMPIEKSAGEFSDRERAYHAYEQGAYEDAIAKFSSLQILGTSDSLYLALSFLEAGMSESAEPWLQAVKKSSDQRWAHVAEWYLMWLYLKTGRQDDARGILDSVSRTPGHRYRLQAGQILEKF